MIALPGAVFRLDRDLILETGTEGSPVGEFDMDLGSISAVFINGEGAYYFASSLHSIIAFPVDLRNWSTAESGCCPKGFDQVLSFTGEVRPCVAVVEVRQRSRRYPVALSQGRECIR